MEKVFKNIEELIEKYQKWGKPQSDTSRMYWAGEYSLLYEKMKKEILNDLENVKALKQSNEKFDNQDKQTRDISILITELMEYYSVLGNKQNAIYKYLKNCEKALMDLLNEFDKQGKKINNKIVFDNVFNYKSDYKTLNKDFKKLEELYKDLNNEFNEKITHYQDKICDLKNIIWKMEEI
ncbi:hypothetical protein LQ356_00650 [Metamycoplasma faucium]|uniref:Uncharacterized protein n=2 Tax=Metamycoplasma faucium TaxID=56142 RepID=A0ABZ2TM62_9BACT